VAPFNFGGPQPETVYPLPADTEATFNYAGSGSWESTRNLHLSARDGFFPGVIVGSVAPRRLVYGHEFSWDRPHDPVWAWLEKIYGYYEAGDHLASAAGRGKVTGQPPESTHCNNIGPVQRKGIYPALKQWFDIPEPAKEARERRPADDLLCLTPEVAAVVKPRPLHELAAELGGERAAAARQRLAELAQEARRQRLRREWARLLGEVEPGVEPKPAGRSSEKVGAATVERIALEVEPGITVPLLLLLPPREEKAKLPVVVGLAQEGKKGFLKDRADVLAALLDGGAAVCLPDLRGTGETRPSASQGRSSADTAISATELMLGQTLVGARLRDLRSVLRYLRGRAEVDAGRVALWGDAFAPVNLKDRRLDVPLDAEQLPDQAEPLGGLLALLGALFEDGVRAVAVRGGLAGYQSVLESPFCYVPHDVIVPGVLTAGDLCDVAGALAPRPLRLEGLVDGRNRAVTADAVAKTFEPARAAYRAAGAEERLRIAEGEGQGDGVARWLLAGLAAR
jgi:hypothetical protein